MKMFFSDDTVVVKFDTAIVGNSEPNRSCLSLQVGWSNDKHERGHEWFQVFAWRKLRWRIWAGSEEFSIAAACYQADQEPLITFIDGEEHDRTDHRSAASREIEEAWQGTWCEKVILFGFQFLPMVIWNLNQLEGKCQNNKGISLRGCDLFESTKFTKDAIIDEINKIFLNFWVCNDFWTAFFWIVVTLCPLFSLEYLFNWNVT